MIPARAIAEKDVPLVDIGLEFWGIVRFMRLGERGFQAAVASGG